MAKLMNVQEAREKGVRLIWVEQRYMPDPEEMDAIYRMSLEPVLTDGQRMASLEGELNLEDAEYGVTWRAWDGEPTVEQTMTALWAEWG